MQDEQQAYTVTAITRMIKSQLEDSFKGVWIQGEISNYLHHSSGHRYFSLKDDNAVIKGVIWRNVGAKMKFDPEDGQKVLAQGDINVYEKGGTYQINVRRLVPVGVGELEMAFRQLKEKLGKEGLFDEDRKKPIPSLVRTVGIVTSATGAAVRDIIQIARRRNDAVELILYPAKVQGAGSAEAIVKGIEYFNQRKGIDVVIIGRGGGSFEDIFCFNEEPVIRAIAASTVPIISAVGHEVDFTLSDFASDMRAPTPSAASEIAVWSKKEYLERVNGNIFRQGSILKELTERASRQLKSLLSRPVFARPLDLIRQREQYVDQLVRLLVLHGKNSFEMHRNRLSLALSRLDTLSPLKIMERGYSVSRRSPGKKLLLSVGDIIPGDRMETILPDGSITSFVEKIDRKKKR